MEDITKIVKSLENPGLLIKRVRKTIQNEAKEQKGAFLSMLLGTLRPSSLKSLLTGMGIIRTDKETVRAGENF